MKIVRLEKDRIKVILSEIDLENMNIDASTLSPTSPELSPFLREVIDAVKAQTGFSATDGQVLVEAMQSGNEIILTISNPTVTKAQKDHISKKSDYAIFEFMSSEHLLELIKNISALYLLAMRLYEYDGKFYLAVPRRKIPILIYEYSFKNRISPTAESILAEYGTLLAGGYRLASISSGLKKLK